MILHKYRWLTWTATLALVLVILLTFAAPALAAEIVTGTPDALIPEGEVIDDDLFITGARVEMNGTVTGDLFVSGQHIIINGTVEGNVIAAGQLLEVNGTVEGALVGAGYGLNLGPAAAIGRNLYFGGFSLVAEEGSVIGRSLYAGDYQTVLNGEVGRNVEVGAGAFQLAGKVGGDVNVQIGESDQGFAESSPYWTFWVPGGVPVIQPGLEISEGALVEGQENYVITTVDVQPPGVSDVTIQIPEEAATGFVVANWVRQRVGEFISLLIVGGLALYLQRDNLLGVIDKIKSQPMPSIGWGVVVFLVFPILVIAAILLLIALVLLISLITLGQLTGTTLQLGGLSIASAMVVFGFTLWLLTKAIFAYFAGSTLLKQVSPTTLEGRWGAVWALVIGALLYELVRSIPLIGALVALLVVLVGIGAIFLFVRERLQAARAAAA